MHRLNKLFAIFVLAVFIVPSVAFAQNFNSRKACLTPDFIQINTSVNTTVNQTRTDTFTTETVFCEYGCVSSINGARCNNNPALIPLAVYIFLGGVSFVFMILTFFRMDIIVFPWIAFIMAAVLTFASVNIDVAGTQMESIPMIWLWAGISVLMFLLAMYITFVQSAEQLREAADRAGA